VAHTEPRAGERVKDVRLTEDTLSVDLLDGRTISVPLAWYPRLLHATPEQRENWQVAGGGFGIHWPEVDEDLSTEGLLRGAPASRPSVPSREAATATLANRATINATAIETIAVRLIPASPLVLAPDLPGHLQTL
jgi:hypothetical protein